MAKKLTKTAPPSPPRYAPTMDGDMEQHATGDFVAVEDYEALRRATDALIEKYIANRGTPHEFICCVTPERRGFSKSSDAIWKLWDDARLLVGEVLP